MRILLNETAAALIDIQEKLFPHMADGQTMLQNSLQLIDGFKVLGVPMLVTQQYTRGLGPTIAPVTEKFADFSFIEKIAFSCCDEAEFMDQLDHLDRRNIILFGIETHVCVLQTCIDLKKQGFQPVVVEDCVTSRRLSDKATAIERMRTEGAIITTMESILFELTRFAGTDVFKSISKIVK